MIQTEAMTRTAVLVSVVVLNYNGERILEDCLESLRRQDYPHYEVIVVDNHSRDQSPRLVKDKFPEFRLIELEKNTGFCSGNHAGVKASRGRFVALVNNDTVLPPDFIGKLAQALQQNDKAWIAAPRIDNRNLDMAAYPHNGTLSVNGLIIQNVFRDPRMLFGAPGAALIFRKDEVGLPFDLDYRFFHEDVYLSWRTWLTGHEVICCPEVVVRHVGSASVQADIATGANRNPWYRWLMERNRLLNLLTFFSVATWGRLAPLLAASLLLEHIQDLLAGRGVWPRWKAYAWLAFNGSQVRKKRRAIQAQRRVHDREILKRLSCRITNVANPLGRLANACSRLWCLAVGLRTAELQGRTREAR